MKKSSDLTFTAEPARKLKSSARKDIKKITRGAKRPPAAPSIPMALASHPSENGGTDGTNGHPELDSKLMLWALMGLKKGDFNVRLPMEWEGMEGKVADTFNQLAEMMAD